MDEGGVIQGQMVTCRAPYQALYRASAVRRLDDKAINEAGIPGLVLMQRAGAGAWRTLRRHWPQARSILVLCGPGNNGGDGLVLARLAGAGGFHVQTLLVGDPQLLRADAATCYRDFVAAGMTARQIGDGPDEPDLSALDGVVDALFGTGLCRPVYGQSAKLIAAVNRHQGFRLSLDIPSGLNADTGKVMGCAVKADVTITFIGMKQGLLTGDGRQYCGEIVYDDLQVPAETYRGINPDACYASFDGLRGQVLGRRDRGAHKGSNGHVLIIGGDRGFAGAPALSGWAAARTGAGLVSVASRPEHLPVVTGRVPELMFRGLRAVADLNAVLARADVVAIGPGLGTGEWSVELLDAVLASGIQHLVLDADALNLLALHPHRLAQLRARQGQVICTPHPGEAARLLAKDVQAVEADRFTACRELQEKLAAVVVLKGPGSLVCSAGKPPWICAGGNPGMASGGMGDVLTGVIAALIAQGLNAEQAAVAGCVLHGAAADKAALVMGGERGLLASDLMVPLQCLVNQL